jgi:hypothetical protein
MTHRVQETLYFSIHLLLNSGPVAILPPVPLTPVANLPPVSLMPVMHLDLRISPRIFEKMRNGPNELLCRAGGKLIHEKNQKQNIS